MTIQRAEFTIASGRVAVYETGFDLSAFVRTVKVDAEASVLIIEVDDFDDAGELLATLERSSARKRKESPAAATAAPGAPPGVAVRGQEVPRPRMPQKCIAPDCIFDVDVGDTCRDHGAAPEEQKAEWRKARADAEKPTPPAEAKRRTRKILEKLNGEQQQETGAAAEPGKVA